MQACFSPWYWCCSSNTWVIPATLTSRCLHKFSPQMSLILFITCLPLPPNAEPSLPPDALHIWQWVIEIEVQLGLEHPNYHIVNLYAISCGGALTWLPKARSRSKNVLQECICAPWMSHQKLWGLPTKKRQRYLVCFWGEDYIYNTWSFGLLWTSQIESLATNSSCMLQLSLMKPSFFFSCANR